MLQLLSKKTSLKNASEIMRRHALCKGLHDQFAHIHFDCLLLEHVYKRKEPVLKKTRSQIQNISKINEKREQNWSGVYINNVIHSIFTRERGYNCAWVESRILFAHLDGTAHDQSTICRQLSAGHVVGSRPMKKKDASNDNSTCFHKLILPSKKIRCSHFQCFRIRLFSGPRI